VEAARFLALHSEDGYVESPARALRSEPEAVSEDDQAVLTEASRRRALDDRIARNQATAAEIERELGYMDARARYLRRQLKRLSRR
jgi:hypothetical protein